MTRIAPAAIAALQSLRDVMAALNSAPGPSSHAYSQARETSVRFAARLIGEADAKRLLDLAEKSGESIEHCLDQMYPTLKCHVALFDGPGQDTKAACVFADVNAAYDWVNGYDGEGVRWTQAVEYVPAAVELPDGVDVKLAGLIAWDLSDAFAKTEDSHHLNFRLDAIKKAMPAIIAAIRAAE